MPNCYECGAQIKFSKAIVSKNGRPIPLELYGAAHDCPNKRLPGGTAVRSRTPIPEEDKPPAYTRGFQLLILEKIHEFESSILDLKQSIREQREENRKQQQQLQQQQGGGGVST